ncbi:MAG: hypothetical protein UT50_C0003G0031 [Candidatus Moranbacteria bacterium GW2011_GWA2_39_41]|nr:MAG: hypothetical protein UT50_C0003G0031 [Candidatus Moranbacteria bacterium GW2011_GWA2_39_41]
MTKNQNVFATAKEANTHQQNFNQDEDLKIEDIPIYTMAKDIEEIEHPDKQGQPIETQTISKNVTEKQKSSPFFSTEVPVKVSTPVKDTAATKVTMPTSNPIPTKTLPITKDISQKPTSPKIFTIIAGVLLLFLGVSAYYYFAITRQSDATTEPSLEVKTTPNTETAYTPELSFSNDKPNYLIVDTSTINNSQIKKIISQYAEDIKKSAITKPIEFAIADSQNNPIDFATFSNIIGFTLSKNILAALNKNFSLFIFNDNGVIGLGLAIDFIKNEKLQTVLLEEELLLAKNLEPILLPADYKLPQTAFGKNIYNGLDIRYQNIISPEDLSIDYTLTDKQLLIGTTKMTLQSIIDKLIPAVTNTNPEQTVDNLLNKD